jgi:transcriptional regulator with XRE-family HTH domain
MTADQIRDVLRSLGKSQTQLANELGIEHNTVWRWIHGVNPIPQWIVAYISLLLRLQITEAALRHAQEQIENPASSVQWC